MGQKSKQRGTMPRSGVNRRELLKLPAYLALSLLPGMAYPSRENGIRLEKKIPVSGELIPVIGMGSWITFDVSAEHDAALSLRTEILKTFFGTGGAMIDSSPMYGNAEAIIGICLQRLSNSTRLFSATKVWTHGKQSGIRQMNHSFQLWGKDHIQLMQIHNMLDWENHYDTLAQWKDEGRIKYIGITTSHGRRHEDLRKVLRRRKFDFVQFTYNLVDTEVEKYLLPLADELGIATIINRPFRHAELFRKVQGRKLPDWASEIGCENWAQYFLKFVVSHPYVTCAIPATSRVDHMRENMGACYGVLPDATTRQRMYQYYRDL